MKAHSEKRTDNPVCNVSTKPKRRKKKLSHAKDTYGSLYDALEDAHNLSKENMLSVFKEGENLKTEIIQDLSKKLKNPTLVAPGSKTQL